MISFQYVDSIRARLQSLIGRLSVAGGLLRHGKYDLSQSDSWLSRRLRAYALIYLEAHPTFETDLYLPAIDASVHCDAKDWLLWPYVRGDSALYEGHLISHAKTLTRPSDVVLDVGANHGTWGSALGMVCGPTGRVVFVEPNPVLVPRLASTIELNCRSFRASLVEMAASDHTGGAIPFYLPTNRNSGAGSTVLHEYAARNGLLEVTRQINVPTITLDDLCEVLALQRVDVLKIDVEFAEDAVIKGASTLLDKFSPRLVICETSGDSWVTTRLKDLGYCAYVVDLRSGRFETVSKEYWGSIFFERVAIA